MPASATFVDVSAWTVGGDSQLGLFTNGVLTLNNDTQDGGAVARLGASANIVKSSATLTFSQLSTVTGATRVSGLDLSALTIGGTNYLANLRSVSFTLGFTHSESSGPSNRWKFPLCVGKDYSANVTLTVPTASVPELVDLYTTLSENDVALSFTLNGVVITVPMVIESGSHSMNYGGIQQVELSLKGQDPLSGNYPTAPTGTTSLLQKAFNAPQTAVAVVATSKAAGGASYSGNFLFESVQFAVSDGELVSTQYTLASQGTITAAVTS